MSGIRRFDGMAFDPADGRLVCISDDTDDSDPAQGVSLRPQVARLLLAFVQTPNQVIPRELLAAEVWDEDRVVDFEAGLSALIRELRVALSEIGRDPAMIETVPRRGYRFHLEPELDPARTGTPIHSKASSRHAPRSAWYRLRTISAFAAAVVVAALLVWIWADSAGWAARVNANSNGAADPVSGPLRLAVLPFTRYHDGLVQPESELRAADAMLAALWQARLERVELIGRTSLKPYSGASNVAERVAEDLNAALILEGSVSEDDLIWRIDIRLLRLPGGSVIWSGTRVRNAADARDVWGLAEDLVAELATDWSSETLIQALAAD